MFRIRQIDDETLPGSVADIEHIKGILRTQLPGLDGEEIDTLSERLRDPLTHQLRALLFVADDMRGHLHSFALVSYAPDVGFCLLDYIASGKRSGGGGIGGALYDRVRSAARQLDAVGLFFECLPDDPAACSDPALAKQNAARLRFYERHGARPIINTKYELPLKPGDLDLPHLVFDDLGGPPLSAAKGREVVRAILERKYGEICSPGYIDTVVQSIQDDPVQLRPARLKARRKPKVDDVVGTGQIALVFNTGHGIHHVRERGYVEAPVRVRSILDGIEPTGLFHKLEVRHYDDSHLTRTHDPDLVQFLDRVCQQVPEGKSVYPYVFPLRNRARLPEDLSYCAGYYCIDTFTPLNRNAYQAARQAVDCALTAADSLLAGGKLAYALVRPPGHHAERDVFGGFCYFNNNAIATEQLAAAGRVAILDVDYHHGNGQQDIFYQRSDVFTVSIHAEPRIAYPFFSGFDDERGEGDGIGCNLNIPLPEVLDGEGYRAALDTALTAIREFAPKFLVVALGLDTAKRDPTGTWPLQRRDFELNGERIGALGLPTLVVQEGGYRTVSLGANARGFFTGLVRGHQRA